MSRRSKKRVVQILGALAVAAGLAFVVVTPGTACGPYCRDIQTRELELACEDGPNRFTGELHFDSPATFTTFLAQQCLPSQSDDVVQGFVDQVDWSTEAVFAASGPAAIDNTRCLGDRTLDRAQVCTDGLKVYFADTYLNADFGCPGPRWTVAFALLRDDLRAALEAGDAVN